MWIGSNTDIHEQKEKEEELRRANDDLQQFAYSASHDLQEPIRNVAIYSEIVAKRYHDVLDADGQQFLGFLTEGGRRLATLINDLLAYTRAGMVESRCDAGGFIGCFEARSFQPGGSHPRKRRDGDLRSAAGGVHGRSASAAGVSESDRQRTQISQTKTRPASTSPRSITAPLGAFQYRTTASASIPNTRRKSLAYSNGSIATRNTAAPASDWQFASAWLSAMADESGSNPTPGKDHLLLHRPASTPARSSSAAVESSAG